MEEDAIATRSHMYDEQTELKARNISSRFAKESICLHGFPYTCTSHEKAPKQLLVCVYF